MKEALSLCNKKLLLFNDKVHNKFTEAKIPKEDQRSSISIPELKEVEILVIIEVIRLGIYSTIEYIDIENKSTRFKNVMISSLEKLSDSISVVIPTNSSGDQLIVKSKEDN